ncbi:MAG: M23 family metallopeptidase [Steroidobacteraceae bacterium]
MQANDSIRLTHLPLRHDRKLMTALAVIAIAAAAAQLGRQLPAAGLRLLECRDVPVADDRPGYLLPVARRDAGRCHAEVGAMSAAFSGQMLSYRFDVARSARVHAARDGLVFAIGVDTDRSTGGRSQANPRGLLLRIRHSDGSIATYQNLQLPGLAVREGQWVASGQLLGRARGGALRFAVQDCVDCPARAVRFSNSLSRAGALSVARAQPAVAPRKLT